MAARRISAGLASRAGACAVLPALAAAVGLAAPPQDTGPACPQLETALTRAECYAGRRDWLRAEQQLRAFLRGNPADSYAAVRHAEALVHLGHSFDAILALERLLKSQPGYPPALKLYASLVYGVEKNAAKAEDVLQRLVKLAPEDAEAWMALGNHYLERLNAPEAVRCFQQASRLAPADELAVAGLASSLGQAGRNAEAEQFFQRAIRIAETKPRRDPRIHLLWGDFLAGLGRHQEAVAAFTEALRVAPAEASAFYKRALAFERLEEYQQAEADAVSAIRAGGDRKPYQMLLVRVYSALGMSDRAAKAAEAVERLGRQEEQERSRGRVLRESLEKAEPLMQQGRFSEAIPHYERIVRTIPAFFEGWFALGVCYSQTAKTADAERALREYVRLQPLSADGHAILGLLLLRDNRPAEARAELEQAVQLDPEAVESRKALAVIHLNNGEWAAAAGVLRPLAAQAEADPESLLMLAEVLLRTGDRTGAASALERVLHAEPDNPRAARIKMAIGR